MYDWVNPTLASRCITRGRVNASARNITSGCRSRTEAISHCQKAIGLVCGLSTRNTVTPWSIQNSTTSRSASHNAARSAVSKSMG